MQYWVTVEPLRTSKRFQHGYWVGMLKTSMGEKNHDKIRAHHLVITALFALDLLYNHIAGRILRSNTRIGPAIVCALEIEKSQSADTNIVCMLPDIRECYLSILVFDDMSVGITAENDPSDLLPKWGQPRKVR